MPCSTVVKPLDGAVGHLGLSKLVGAGEGILTLDPLLGNYLAAGAVLSSQASGQDPFSYRGVVAAIESAQSSGSPVAMTRLIDPVPICHYDDHCQAWRNLLTP